MKTKRYWVYWVISSFNIEDNKIKISSDIKVEEEYPINKANRAAESVYNACIEEQTLINWYQDYQEHDPRNIRISRLLRKITNETLREEDQKEDQERSKDIQMRS
jgi:predicted transcriptional regulator